MNIKPLLDVTCQAVADLIKGKTTEEIRKHFNIKVVSLQVAHVCGVPPKCETCSDQYDIFFMQNDFTPEEEEEVARENQWVSHAVLLLSTDIIAPLQGSCRRDFHKCVPAFVLRMSGVRVRRTARGGDGWRVRRYIPSSRIVGAV